MLPDFSWHDREDLDRLYLLAISKDLSLRSIRDLTAAHLPLLQELQTKVIETVQKTYGLPSDEIACFFHYHPSFYRLHLHVTRLEIDCHPLRVQTLSSVIQNIELCSDYFQRFTFTLPLRESDPLYALLSEQPQ
jgi:m7GpppX diphosphatase